MASGPTAYLVEKRLDGFVNVITLLAGQSWTLGRAPTNRIVLKDDLSSREHAEISHDEHSWRIRDLGSLNGTRVNDFRVEPNTYWDLEPNSEIHVGRSIYVFVERMDQLPAMPARSPDDLSSISIKKRVGHTRFLTPVPLAPTVDAPAEPPSRHGLRGILSLLYRLALNMGSVESIDSLCALVIDALLEATPAEIIVILLTPSTGSLPGIKKEELKENTGQGRNGKKFRVQDMKVASQRFRDQPNDPTTPNVPMPLAPALREKINEIGADVLATQKAVLAEDLATLEESDATANGADDTPVPMAAFKKPRPHSEKNISTSPARLICAPVAHEERFLGLLYIQATTHQTALDDDDVEFTMAVAKQMGLVLYQLQKQESLSNAYRSLRAQLHVESELIGASESMKQIEMQIARVAGTNATCLIRGESGVGKELVARAVHYSSPRSEGPFICLNCAALTETLLESELFGHEKGSFTGATDRKIGKFEAANHGTIFLDEIGEMHVGTQSKLLRILEGQQFERVGGSVPIQVDVRVVAATNQPLEKAVADGTFRLDLFYRLQVVQLLVPPLRDRKGDIPALADHFFHRFVREMGRKMRGFTPAALQKLTDYHWPGNVRELRNVIERAVALGNGPLLDVADIWLSSLEIPGLNSGKEANKQFEPLSLEEVEKEHILLTLEHTDWNKSQAATILKIERSTLDRKIRAYGLRRS